MREIYNVLTATIIALGDCPEADLYVRRLMDLRDDLSFTAPEARWRAWDKGQGIIDDMMMDGRDEISAIDRAGRVWSGR